MWLPSSLMTAGPPQGSLVLYVLLPREWFQEIERMMTVHSMHGLFLTCIQESHLYLYNVQATVK
jgi:hypothetical protein